MGLDCHMLMTSVSGHLLNYEFVGNYKKWYACNPVELFDAPVRKSCPADSEGIKHTLEREVKHCQKLVIWTDCDREGENIGFEIIKVCQAIKPNLQVYRARFSEITAQSANRAAQNLVLPDQNTSNAVDIRQELDLRIGASFTRFQTLRYQKVFPKSLGESLISYGSCQFPTLGFVVERYKAIESFIPETFWKIKVTHAYDGEIIEFSWKRVRLFHELACQVLHETCQETSLASVENVVFKPKNKWRPLPLDTVELEKLSSRKLHINAKETMRMAEHLYTQGLISYPRTETNIFPKELNLVQLVETQVHDPIWGGFAQRVIESGPNPRQGKKTDQAHPPIHPIKYTNSLQGDEKKVYEFIVRHFLACCSKDAEGRETIVNIDIANEKFVASGLIIVALNYLEVYPYEKWNSKVLPFYETGQQFEPTSIDILVGQTSAPPLLTEADLIGLMEKHGIGTDATHAEHIEKIKSRLYVGVQNDGRFLPGELGMGLVQGYDAMGFQMSKPHLRSQLEADLKQICEGLRDPKVVLNDQILKYKEVFIKAIEQVTHLDEALEHYLHEVRHNVEGRNELPQIQSKFCVCSSCGMDMFVNQKKNSSGYFIGCMGYPQCRNGLSMPESIISIKIEERTCQECDGNPHLVTLTFVPGAFAPLYPDMCTVCIGGCDRDILETLGVKRPLVHPIQPLEIPFCGNSTDSGFFSGDSFTNSNIPVTSTNLQRGDTILPRTQTRHWINDQNNPTSNLSNICRMRNSSSQQQLPVYNLKQWNNNCNIGNSNTSTKLQSRTQPVKQQGGVIVCFCNEKAILLTVRKEAATKGRQFYKCRKPTGQGCKFFHWADDQDCDQHTTNRNIFPESGNGSTTTFASSDYENQGAQCKCRKPAKRLTVQKMNANKGREFYCCDNPHEKQCHFFQWVDETDGDGPQREVGHSQNNYNNGRGGTRRHRGGNPGSKTPNNASSASKKRKCGNCLAEGHNRRNCSNLKDL